MKQTRITKNQLRAMIKEAVLKEQSTHFSKEDLFGIEDAIYQHKELAFKSTSSAERQHQHGIVKALEKAIVFIKTAQANNASMSEQYDFNDEFDAYDEEEEKAEIERVGLARYEKNLDDSDRDRMKNRKK